MPEVLDQQVSIINNSIELFRTAPNVLKANQERTQKALTVGKNILDSWSNAWNLENEDERMAALSLADERSNNYLANCSVALKEEKELRAAITQMMDEFKKMFTAAENDIDKAKDGSIPASVQQNRNKYASEVRKIQERKRIEEERKARKSQEAIDIKTEFEIVLHQQFNDFLLKAKIWLTNQFNNLKLEGFSDAAAQIRLYKPEYKQEAFEALRATTTKCTLHNDEELVEIHHYVKQPLQEIFANTYAKEMEALKSELVDKIPSKHEELKEQKRLADEAENERLKAEDEARKRAAAIAKANAEEKERLEKETAEAKRIADEKAAELKRQQDEAARIQKEREEEENRRLATEAEEAKRKAEQEAELKKQGDQTMLMFEKEAAIADVPVAPESKTGYEIEVLHPVAYTQLFALWFEQEGKNLPINKIGNTKLDQIKGWAEKYAVKNGTKIESKFLKYNEVVTAVNRKAK